MNESPKLIHNLATGKWLLKNGGETWTVIATMDALAILSFLELDPVDQNSPDYLAVSQGKAQIISMDEYSCLLELTPFKGGKSKKLEIHPAQVDFGIVDCISGFHSDQWVETESIMALEDVRSLGLRFYLPEDKTKGNKTLDCYLGGRKIQTLEMKRGAMEEVWLDIGETELSRSELRLKASYKEPNASDERSLGMIFSEININLTDWQPVEVVL